MLPIPWRAWLARLGGLWRRSLQLRTILLTLALSAIAVTAIGLTIAGSVRANLFEQRRDQVVAEAGRATLAAQQVFSTAEDAGLADDLDAVRTDALAQVRLLVSSSALVGFQRAPGQPGVPPMVAVASAGFDADEMVSEELQAAVVAGGEGSVSWQPLALVEGDETHPGLIVGSLVRVPDGDLYELFVVYDLHEEQQTLDFVQLTLLLGGAALLLLIAAVAYLVARLVVGPVRLAAETSEEIADGDLDRRLPERGDDELATLARSFNRMTDGLQQQIARLAALSLVQQRFVSDVSHELRTPLTTIRLAGDVLYDQREDFAPATKRTAELLHTQTERFESLLGDLLEMSRYDAGAAELDTEPTNLVRLAEDAIDALAPLAAEKGCAVRIIAPGGHFEAEVDARRVRRILQNLLGNAIDHGEARPIDVHVDSDELAVAIAVRDHGIGMTAEEVDRVVDRFWRADPSRQRTTGGTGLGLAISLEDAALHGGTLEVWSEPGEGSCFLLTLPRRPGGELRGSPVALPPPEPVDPSPPLAEGVTP